MNLGKLNDVVYKVKRLIVMWFTICKRLLRWLLTIDNIYFVDMISVVKRSVNKLFECCKHRAWKFFKHWKLLLKNYFRGCLQDQTVVCKLSVWILASCLQRYILVYDVNKLLRWFNVIYHLQRSCLNVC